MSFLIRGAIVFASLGALFSACPQKQPSKPEAKHQQGACGQPFTSVVPCTTCNLNTTSHKLLGTLNDPDGTHSSWFPIKSLQVIVCDRSDCSASITYGQASLLTGLTGDTVSAPYSSSVSATNAWMFWIDNQGNNGCASVTVSP